MPNFNLRSILTRNPFPKHRLLPVKTIQVSSPNPAKFLHDEGCPPPSPPRLNAVPDVVLNRLARKRGAKSTLLGNDRRSNACPPFIDRHGFMPNRSNKGGFFIRTLRIPDLRPVKYVVTRKESLPFISRPSGTRIPILHCFPSIFSGIIKKPFTIHPPPSIGVLFERGNFTIEKNDFLFFLFFFSFALS